MSKRNRSVLSVGISSILMVFVVLCLITFAVLALSSAKADLKYSEQTAERTKQYYEAEMRANQQLVEIDAQLQEQYNKDSMEVGKRITFSETINDTSLLEVELEVLDPKEADGQRYRIERWQSVSSENWEPDMSLPVMQRPATSGE